MNYRRIINFRLIILILIIYSGLCSFGQSHRRKISREEYIKMYKDIAIQEMVIYNIPASITLAQGILESGSGNSTLATQANNHFGIKCHKGWDGPSIKFDDDKKRECFRKYDQPYDSYKDHSFFLSRRSRYLFLFDLEITDYKGWAKGLKKAGYATNPKYAVLLIKIIEENNLQRFDLMDGSYIAVNQYPNEIPQDISKSYEAFAVGKNDRQIFTNNGKKFIFARKDDNFHKIAQDFNIYTFQIYKYNELKKKDKFKEGQMVYLEKKRNKAKMPFHKVKPGETMYSISQLYGIKLKQLYKKNRMKPGTKPLTWQKLWMQDKKPENIK